MSARGNISDIFFSFQGEGIYLGEPQVFVRFANCNISPKCLYCDTDTRTNSRMTVCGILDKIEREKWPTRFISLTGGEPLLQIDFLEKFLPRLKRKRFKTYLETNGTLPEALARIIGNIDIIAMDIKLPTSGGTMPFWEKHSQFLKLCRKKELLVKVVLTGDTERDDIEKAIDLVKETPSIPFIFQPVTPNKRVKGIGDRRLREFHSLARKRLKNVGVIPQVHAVLGVR